MQQILLDTNVIIYHVNGDRVIEFDPYTTFVSTITVFELLQYSAITRQEEKAIKAILEICNIIPVNTAIAERAAIFARKHNIGSMDMLIAATAIELGIPLMTYNTKDFKKIPFLKMGNELSFN
ncbi:MAG: type II toxin-antitoxin system VapC family toxin [Candidatus Kerfeldbacteria bacterium]|nr:type II toxin-antitoxin system VapC family toxin [Candidatus Kerfeldbacteria bacterium]